MTAGADGYGLRAAGRGLRAEGYGQRDLESVAWSPGPGVRRTCQIESPTGETSRSVGVTNPSLR